MLAYKANAYRVYNRFRSDLRIAFDPAAIDEAVNGVLPAFNATAVAIVEPIVSTRQKETAVDWYIGGKSFWLAFRALCASSREPLTRIQRLNPHPVALSDIRQHPRLLRRSEQLGELLLQQGMNDAFIVPVLDQQLELSLVVFAGLNLKLRPTSRHLMTQVALDIVGRLQTCGSADTAKPQHLKLTERQMEVAEWLVAGKSDWEIGEILRISPKTVNFHVENIKRMYGVRSRTQFIAAIVHEGGLQPA